MKKPDNSDQSDDGVADFDAFAGGLIGRNPEFYIAHVPEDSHHAAGLAEALKRNGAQVVGRSVQIKAREARPSFSKELDDVAYRHLEQLSGSDPMPMEFRVFLSYASEDFDDIWLFHLELLGMGMSTFLDQSHVHGIHLGENWIDVIFEMLSTCCAMIFFMSPHSIENDFVMREIGFFLERMKVRTGLFFAIVLLCKVDVQALRTSGVTVIDLYRQPVKAAAEEFMHEMVEFYRRTKQV